MRRSDEVLKWSKSISLQHLKFIKPTYIYSDRDRSWPTFLGKSHGKSVKTYPGHETYLFQGLPIWMSVDMNAESNTKECQHQNALSIELAGEQARMIKYSIFVQHQYYLRYQYQTRVDENTRSFLTSPPEIQQSSWLWRPHKLSTSAQINCVRLSCVEILLPITNSNSLDVPKR